MLDLIDEDDCKDLKSQLREVTSDYDELQFDCNSYSSLRWLEDQATQLCSLSPCGVIVAPLQVCTGKPNSQLLYDTLYLHSPESNTRTATVSKSS